MSRSICLLSTLTLCLFACPTLLSAQTPWQTTLLDSASGLRVQGATISSAEVAPDCPTSWSIRQVTLHGGKQEGVELLVVDNGPLQMTLIPTRGMGILCVEHAGMRIGWQSPVREVVHPQFVNLQSRDGLGWLEGFNEWMVRCGLESNGHPGIDKFISNTGDEAEMQLTLHGKIANIPSSTVQVTAQTEAPYAITISGRVDEVMFYGPKLELHTSITLVPGEPRFRLTDRIHNRGAAEQEFEMLYHTNFGRPFLGRDSRFVGAIKSVRPFNAHAASGIKQFDTYQGPTPGFIEQVYLLDMLADAQSHTEVLLRNASGDRGVSMKWSVKQLPYMTLWKNEAAVADGYVTGLEPGTNYPNLRSIERKAGRVPRLAAGADYRMSVEFGFHGNEMSVREVEQRIRVQQGDHPIELLPLEE